jgi:hypothetical protein
VRGWPLSTVGKRHHRSRNGPMPTIKIVGGAVRHWRDGPHSPWAPESAKEKKLVLVALMMTQEEFNKLAANRNELIVESSSDDGPNNDAPIPANELVVTLSDLFTDESVDMSRNDGGVMGEEGGIE